MELIDRWHRLREFPDFTHRVMVGTPKIASLMRDASRRERIVELEQVHGNTVAVVSHDQLGADVVRIAGADGAVTQDAHLHLTLRTADCIPVSVVVPRAGALAVVHVGWRGAANNAVQHLLVTLWKRTHALPHETFVHLGPSISPHLYDVTDAHDLGERTERFRRAFPAGIGLTRAGDRTYLKLWEAITWQLRSARVPRAHIELNGVCTVSDVRSLPSHYRDGPRRTDSVVTMLGRRPMSVAFSPEAR